MNAPSPPLLAGPVLVLGATGVVGRFLIPRLAETGVVVMGVSRDAAADVGAAVLVQADLGRADLEARLPECATVISLSDIWHLPQALPALRARGMCRLVAVSSTSVLVKANSPDNRERRTAERLSASEAAVRAFCETHQIPWTILRPTLIWAEGKDGNVSRLARLIRKLGFLPLMGTGQGLRQPVHADDLAQGVLTAASAAAARRRTYDLPGGETLSYRIMVERVFEGMGRRPLIVTAPAWVWTVGFTVLRPLLKGATAQMGARMSVDLTFDAGPAIRDLDWRPRKFHPDFRPISARKVIESRAP